MAGAVGRRTAPFPPVGTPDGDTAPVRQLLTGWGRTSPVAARLVAPADEAELISLVGEGGQGSSDPDGERARHRGIIARGLGRSYGDAAQRAGGLVVSTGRLDQIGPVDDAAGTVTVGAGVSLENLISRLLPLGWFVAVTPGTRQVSVGGAIAADIHGKNHHRDGSFGRHVIELTVVTPGGPGTVSPDDDGELFWATVGGMGLTGIVTRAVLRLIRVDTSWVVADTDRFADLDGLMAAMIASDASHRYSVGWVDCAARGRHLGRGVLTSGDHAAAGTCRPAWPIGPADRHGPLASGSRPRRPGGS